MEIEDIPASTTKDTSSSSSSSGDDKPKSVIPKSVVDRYYERFYCENPDGHLQFVNQHTNGLVAIGLAEQHPLAQHQRDGTEGFEIVEIDFSVSNDKGKDFTVSGKKKQGGPKIMAEGLLCIITCKNSQTFNVFSCVEGNLLEFNWKFCREQNSEGEWANLFSEHCESSAYISILKPRQKKYSEGVDDQDFNLKLVKRDEWGQ